MSHKTWFNEHTYEVDFTESAPHKIYPSKELKKRKKVVYCTSYPCTRPERLAKGEGYQHDKFREIPNPPGDGWCVHCGNALYTCYEVVK